MPACGTGHTMILMAQAVPSATQLPCVAALPTGWGIGIVTVHSGEATINLGIDKIGSSAIVVTLTAQCPAPGPSSVQPTPSEINLHPVAGGASPTASSLLKAPNRISSRTSRGPGLPAKIGAGSTRRTRGRPRPMRAGAPCDP